ncbi:MAG: ATP-dependent Clp protease ATP-binding subunit [Bacteroidales bacterium]|nr:ATP-dependent Clp protease ATP-binding subunit [Bacteroidales bacterium]
MEMRISDELNLMVRYAREEAMRTGSYGIGVDHLMLGILRHADNNACRALRGLGADPEEMKQFIDMHIFRQGSIPYSDADQVVLSRSAQSLLNLTILEATRLKHAETDGSHMLLAVCRTDGNYSQVFLKNHGVNYPVLLNYMQEQELFEGMEDKRPEQTPEQKEEFEKAVGHAVEEVVAAQENSVEEFGLDLTKAAEAGVLDPVVGRDVEIARIIEILGRRKKNNPMLIGEPGVGKSAIVEGLALKIAAGDVPPALKRKRLISLDIASVVAGTRYRGDFEKRLKGIIENLKANPDIILFIDEFHTIVGAGGAQGSLDAANMLKPALARGEIQCIGATTMDEFTKIIEKDGALNRRFLKVVVEATDVPQSIDILRNLQENYENFHNVKYSPEAIEACVRQTDRYITDRALPDKAIDVMDEAGSMVRLRMAHNRKGSNIVDADDIACVVSRMTGIPVSKVAESEGHRLLAMSERLRGEVVGQDEAVDTVVRAIRRNRAGLKDPRRPVGTFLFFGPTGVGKTRLAKCLAEYLFDSEDNIVRVDMSEYSKKFTSSRLVGAPPGYVGHEEGGQLSEKVRRKPYCVVLLDEIEKAHPDIFNLLLQVLDEGRLTDSNGRTVNFRNTIVIMTSNVGSRELEEYGSGVGFARPGKDVEKDRRNVLEKAVKKLFPPEFINRVDEKVYFNSLTREDLHKIIDLELKDLKARVQEAGYKLVVTPSAKEFVADAGYDPAYGARPLKRAVTKHIEDPVSEYIITDRMLRKGAGGTLRVSLSKDKEHTRVTRTASHQ